MEYETLVAFAGTWWLLGLIALSIIVLVYALRPSNRKRFSRAKQSILEENDKPKE